LSDKIFGLSVQEVQEEMKKLPQPVKVNVQVKAPKSHPLSPEVKTQLPTESVQLYPVHEKCS
jgi:hypothetical protein